MTFILTIQKGWSAKAKSHYNEKQKRLKVRILNYIDRHFTSRKGTVEGGDAKVRGGSWCPQKSRSHDRTSLSLFLSLRFSQVGAKYLSAYKEWFCTLNPQSPKIWVFTTREFCGTNSETDRPHRFWYRWHCSQIYGTDYLKIVKDKHNNLSLNFWIMVLRTYHPRFVKHNNLSLYSIYNVTEWNIN